MLRYGFVPYRREGQALLIVVSDPSDLHTIDESACSWTDRFRVCVGTPSAIQNILKKSESSQRVLEEATKASRCRFLREDDAGDETLTVDKLTSGPEPGHPAGGLHALHRTAAARVDIHIRDPG
jgi:type IV pilus assembly protein PilB